MSWRYSQSTGELLDPTGQRIATGYSGTGLGRNNPDMEAVRGIGPTPKGRYIIGKAYTSIGLGPCVMNLDPAQDTNTFGRDLFRIHGDNSDHDASHGCIILPPGPRKSIAVSSDRIMEVVG